jgi:hypothetical protein
MTQSGLRPSFAGRRPARTMRLRGFLRFGGLERTVMLPPEADDVRFEAQHQDACGR